MKNGRENRNNGNQEKGKEEKEALGCFKQEATRGRSRASPKFLGGKKLQTTEPQRSERKAAKGAKNPTVQLFATLSKRCGIRFSFIGHRLRYEQKLQWMPGFAWNLPSAIPWAASSTRLRAPTSCASVRVVTTGTFSARL